MNEIIKQATDKLLTQIMQEQCINSYEAMECLMQEAATQESEGKLWFKI
tara:strand:- start:360 stop:506 length:147 start_codon:yes stop_codon:yes gene_type:complete